MTTVQLLDASGAPLRQSPDPKDERIAELERQLDEAKATIHTLKAKIKEDEVDMLVSLAIGEGRLLPQLRPWALTLGRRDFCQLQAFVQALPVLSGSEQGGQA